MDGVRLCDRGDVDHEFVRVADVDECVLERFFVGAWLQADRQHRWEPADDGEEGYRCDVSDAGGGAGAHPGDGAWQHAADQQFVARLGVEICGVDDHFFSCHASSSESLVVGVAWMPTIRHPLAPRATSKCTA